MSPHVDLQMVTSALYEDRHLVGDLADVSITGGEDGKAGALAGRGHDEEACRHLDDRLTRVAADGAARAAGQRLERRRERGQVINGRLVHATGCAQCQAVLGEEYRPRDMRYPHHQVIKEPIKLIDWISMVDFHPLSPLCPFASVTGLAASRAAWRTGCCACLSTMPR